MTATALRAAAGTLLAIAVAGFAWWAAGWAAEWTPWPGSWPLLPLAAAFGALSLVDRIVSLQK